MAQSHNLNYRLLSAAVSPQKFFLRARSSRPVTRSSRCFTSSPNHKHERDGILSSEAEIDRSLTQLPETSGRRIGDSLETNHNLHPINQGSNFKSKPTTRQNVAGFSKNLATYARGSVSSSVDYAEPEPRESDWIPIENVNKVKHRDRRTGTDRKVRTWTRSTIDSRTDNRRPTLSEVAASGRNQSDSHALRRKERPDRDEKWKVQKDALDKKFDGIAWNPRKKLSPDAIEGIRNLHAQDPERFSTPNLADQFKISPEAIRRILKSKWKPTAEEVQDRRERWSRRHDRLWDQQQALGLRPQRRKDRALEDPDQFERDLARREALGEI